MNISKYFATLVAIAFLCISSQTIVSAQTAGEGPLASVFGGGGTIRWEVFAPNSGGTLTISTPDNRSLRKSFRAGNSPEFSLGEKQMDSLPDGVYAYEL